MLEAISAGKRWPAHIQLLPSLHSNLATSYHAKRNYLKEAYYLLHLCFISDPVLYPSCVYPACIHNQFILTIVLYKLAKDSTTVSKLPLQSFELGLIYKCCIIKVAKDV